MPNIYFTNQWYAEYNQVSEILGLTIIIAIHYNCLELHFNQRINVIIVHLKISSMLGQARSSPLSCTVHTMTPFIHTHLSSTHNAAPHPHRTFLHSPACACTAQSTPHTESPPSPTSPSPPTPSSLSHKLSQVHYNHLHTGLIT